VIAAAPGEHELRGREVAHGDRRDAAAVEDRDVALGQQAHAEAGRHGLVGLLAVADLGGHRHRVTAALVAREPERARHWVRRGQGEEWLVAQVGHRHFRVAGEPVPGRQRDEAPLAGDRAPAELRLARERAPDEGRVAAAVAEACRGVLPPHLAQFQLRRGALLGQSRPHQREQPAARAGLHAHHQRARRRARQLALGGVPAREHLACGGHEGGAGAREGDGPPGAVEQPGAEEALERPDLTGEHRLADVERLGGLREVQTLGDGEEGAQVAQVDVHAAFHTAST